MEKISLRDEGGVSHQPRLVIQPVTQRVALAFVAQHHRHHLAPRGAKFCIGLNDGESVVGVVTVGRPVARHYDDGYTAEVTRCCVLEGVPNGCSMLYGAAWRVSREMGYRRIITYTLASESGIALRAAGWKCLGERRGGSWSRPSRLREDKHPVEKKVLWKVSRGDGED